MTVQPLLGTLGDRFEVGTGDLAIAIPFLAEVVPLDLLGARVEVPSVTPSALRLVLRGAVARDQIRDRLVSLWATKLEKKIARDCGTREMPSSCGCVTRDGEEYGSADLLGIFDHRPADCRITVDEIMTNSLVISLLSPDVTLDGVPAVTFNIGFAAVPAEFTAPP